MVREPIDVERYGWRYILIVLGLAALVCIYGIYHTGL
jgi:hypothetical protein